MSAVQTADLLADRDHYRAMLETPGPFTEQEVQGRIRLMNTLKAIDRELRRREALVGLPQVDTTLPVGLKEFEDRNGWKYN